MRRRALLGFALGTGALAALPRPDARAAAACGLMIGAPAGSGGDRIARNFARCFARHLDSAQVEPINHPGNAGHDMLAALADAPPTGATIGWIVTPTLPARAIDRSDPTLIGRIRLLGHVEREPIAFVSQSDNPADSVQEIIRRAGEDADAVPLATPPPGSPPHLAALRLQDTAQTRLNIVTFPSSAAARQALIAGNVSAAALGLSEVIGPVLDGTLSALGIAAHRRFGLLPDTPVLDEAGIPLHAFIHRGVGVPVGTPQSVVDRLAAALQAAVADETFQQQADKAGYYAAWSDGEAWSRQMRQEHETLVKLWQTDPWLASSNG
ncbi:MAG TPA: tripartite tricarboxylate transporter substrate-binding protein [Rhodopila sp.]|jgi:tripartite-type tricarboxylate transporter receptor subunit TctC|nr:tripartite tricarboxylate transporter substrate-binding protein [Rhodopila sp.]